jgi:hypothetical protein
LRASYQVVHLLNEESRALSVGEFVRKCVRHVGKEICKEKVTDFNIISLSRATMTRRIDNISSDVLNLEKSKRILKLFST